MGAIAASPDGAGYSLVDRGGYDSRAPQCDVDRHFGIGIDGIYDPVNISGASTAGHIVDRNLDLHINASIVRIDRFAVPFSTLGKVKANFEK